MHMQAEFLKKLSQSVQNFVIEVEQSIGFEITVIPDIKQNGGGTTKQGKLATNISQYHVQLFVPTNGYFPNGGVRHEVLHAKRFLLDGVPKLALADHVELDNQLANRLTALDNALEHLVIVPVEISLHPERGEHWEIVLRDISLQLPEVPEEELRLAVFMHLTFIRHVLPKSPFADVLRRFAGDHNLLEGAEIFADQMLASLSNKEELVRQLFLTFPEIPKERSALEYIGRSSGRYQKPIPS